MRWIAIVLLIVTTGCASAKPALVVRYQIPENSLSVEVRIEAR